MNRHIRGMRLSNLIFAITTLMTGLSLLGCSSQEEPAENKLTQQVTDPGQQLFLNHCLGCHMGSGNPPEPNAVIMASEKLVSRQVFTAYVRSPDNTMMPAFPSSQLTDGDLALLYEYVQKLKATQR